MREDLSNEKFIESWIRLGCDDYLPAEKILEILCKGSKDISDVDKNAYEFAMYVYTKRISFEQYNNKIMDLKRDIDQKRDELQQVKDEINLLKAAKYKELNDKEFEQILRMKSEQHLYNIKDELIKENLKLMREIEEHRFQLNKEKENLKEVREEIKELKSVYAEKLHTVDLLDKKLKKLGILEDYEEKEIILNDLNERIKKQNDAVNDFNKIVKAQIYHWCDNKKYNENLELITGMVSYKMQLKKDIVELETKLNSIKEHYVSAEHLETRAVELDKREKVVNVYEGKKLENIKIMIADKKVQLNTIVKDIDKKKDKIDSLKEQIVDLIQQKNSEIDQLQQARLSRANAIYKMQEDLPNIESISYITNSENKYVSSQILTKTKLLNKIEQNIVNKTGILNALKLEYDKVKSIIDVNNINIKAYTDYGNRFLTLINQLQEALIILATKRGIKVDNSAQALEFIKKYKQITTDKTVSNGVLPTLSCDTLAPEVVDIYTELYGTQLDDSILRDLALIKKHGSIEEYLERFKNEF